MDTRINIDFDSLLAIFRFLKPKDHFRLRLVSQKLEMDNENIRQIMAISSHLTGLCLEDVELSNDLSADISSNFPKIKHIEFYGFYDFKKVSQSLKDLS